MGNLYLIGIMGCGKSTVGKKAAKIINAPFFDVDHEIERRKAMTIGEIFVQLGEKGFREIESEVLADLSKEKFAVISTGGGIILREENVNVMQTTGKIIWIKRPLDKIMQGINTRVRPLIKNDPGRIRDIYTAREPLYQKYADVIVDNDKKLNETAQTIAKLFGSQHKN